MQQRSVDHTLSLRLIGTKELIKEFRMNQKKIEEICDLAYSVVKCNQ